MSEKYKVLDNSKPNFITMTVIDWVDLFTRKQICSIIDDSLNYCIKEKGLVVYAYVYMPSHLHLLVASRDKPIPAIVRDFKSFTAKKIIKSFDFFHESRRYWLMKKFNYAGTRIKRNEENKIWKDGFHPLLIDKSDSITRVIDYIHQNPVEAGFIFKEEDWVNSSARFYSKNEMPNVAVEHVWK
jgi:REP element-mobilizing transposase RayT